MMIIGDSVAVKEIIYTGIALSDWCQWMVSVLNFSK